MTYYQRNRERILAAYREKYRQKHPNASRHYHDGKSAIRQRFATCRRGANDRKLLFDLSFEVYEEITSKPCHYCSGPLSPTGGNLDRIDNTKGYSINNVLPCCYACNSIRGDSLTVEEAEVAIKAVLQFRMQKSNNSSQ